MKKIKYAVRFFTYWHCGTGLTSGSDIDAVVIKNQEGLPIIPGKTIKGLLREALETIDTLVKNDVEATRLETVEAHDLFRNCHFSDATLSSQLASQLRGEKAQIRQFLYSQLSSTAINENGTAKEHTLRRIEVCVPLTLYGEIWHFPDDPGSVENLHRSMQWVKALGLGRNRGLGKCSIEIIS